MLITADHGIGIGFLDSAVPSKLYECFLAAPSPHTLLPRLHHRASLDPYKSTFTDMTRSTSSDLTSAYHT